MSDRPKLIKALAGITDPEVGLDIVALGLIYNTQQADNTVTVDMTMTTPFCPLKEYFTQEIKRAAQAALGKKFNIKVTFNFEPVWSPGMIDRTS